MSKPTSSYTPSSTPQKKRITTVPLLLEAYVYELSTSPKASHSVTFDRMIFHNQHFPSAFKLQSAYKVYLMNIISSIYLHPVYLPPPLDIHGEPMLQPLRLEFISRHRSEQLTRGRCSPFETETPLLAPKLLRIAVEN